VTVGAVHETVVDAFICESPLTAVGAPGVVAGTNGDVDGDTRPVPETLVAEILKV